MSKRHSLMTLVALLIITGSTLLQPVATNSAAIQQPAPANDRERGVELYQKGDVTGAVDALRSAVKRDQNDLAAWHYLGLALEQKGDKGGAKKAHEKAAKLGESLLDRQLNQTPNTKEIPRALLVVRSE